ncbi:MAG: hypothetical protein HYV90_01640 [Candidatus Woesebacteria bacterium]|nr:MAG: hypothetical protein HYV90_01640 [Candidatus Woesebacteria bacterium]
MQERFLERIGLLKHQFTAEEVNSGEKRLKELTADYLTEKIGLEEYLVETDKLPKLDLRKLAQKLEWH